VFEATLALLDESGYGELSLEKVARRAGVSRPSLYRRWPNKAAVVVAALAEAAGTDPAPDTGRLEGDLLAVQREMAALYNTAFARHVVPALLGDLVSHPELAQRFRAAYITPRRASVHKALDRARDRGEITGGDPELVCDLLAGPLLLEAFVLDRRVDDAYIRATVRAVMAALTVQAQAPRPEEDGGSRP
jgi:AcrR family transcriptional regulator